MSTYSVDQVGADTDIAWRPVAGGSRVAAEMLAALLVVHVAFLLFIAYESPVLSNMIILLQGSLPAELQSLLVTVGGGFVDTHETVAERIGIGVFYAVLWLGLIVWQWRRGGWLVPVLALAAGIWEAYWRIDIIQLQAGSGHAQNWLVLFGLLCAAVAILAGLIGLIAAASRKR